MRSIAAFGDVTDPNYHGGIPYNFYKACVSEHFAEHAWKSSPKNLGYTRLAWNALQLSKFNRCGGYQYSEDCIRLVSSKAAPFLFSTEVITFSQHYPCWKNVREQGGRLNCYVDATFQSLLSMFRLRDKLSRRVIESALQTEREQYEFADRIITRARWCSEHLVNELGIDKRKVFTILPGANLELPEDWNQGSQENRSLPKPTFNFGIVGRQWKRKGLDVLLKVTDELCRRGLKIAVHSMGFPSSEIRHHALTNWGHLDKRKDYEKILRFYKTIDLGCLFSEAEPFGLSILEFLHAGIPVAGFDRDGLRDSIPPDAGFRFKPGISISDIADVLEAYIKNESIVAQYKQAARDWAPLVTWKRCIQEFKELWQEGQISNPVQPWTGMPCKHE